MKLGLLTLPLHTNYGGILQAYALQKFLINEGHNAIFIRREFDKPNLKTKLKIYLHKIRFIRFHYIASKNQKNFNEFINEYIVPQSVKINSSEDLENYIFKEKIDALVVGSDQVWRYDYAQSLYKNFFLNFKSTFPVRKISYAASFGKDIWEEKQIIDEVTGYLEDFDHISVRETSGVDICKQSFGINAQKVLDPVALFKKEDYTKLLGIDDKNKVSKYIFGYILDRDSKKIDLLNKISVFNDKPVNVIYGNQVNKVNYKFYQKTPKPKVLDWLKAFNEASFIVTDSFHGTLLAIIFQKQFICLGNPKRGMSRFESLLSSLDLSNRLIKIGDNPKINYSNDLIDYSKVNTKLENMRNDSISFLKNALSK